MRHQNSFLTTLATLSFLCATPALASEAPTAEEKVNMASYLPLQDLKTLRLVSHACKDIADSEIQKRNIWLTPPMTDVNSADADSVKSFLKFLQNTSVPRVSFRKLPLSDLLLTDFSSATSGMTALTHLDLSYLGLSDKILQLGLAKLPNLKHLDVRFNNLREADLKALNLSHLDVLCNKPREAVTKFQDLNLFNLNGCSNNLGQYIPVLPPLRHNIYHSRSARDTRAYKSSASYEGK